MSNKSLDVNEMLEPVISGLTRSENWRRIQLKRLTAITEEHESEILSSLATDLGKPATEGLFEIISLKQELKVAQKNLTDWMRPKLVNVPLFLKPGKAKLQNEPLGCVLIIGAWNYPFMLTLQPLISALAAGNTAVLKPSEFAPSTSNLIARLISKHFPKDVVRVLEGDSEFSKQLMNNKFDHIFFTGGSKTGAKIMEAAAKHLTPVTLELGGKNPAIVLKGSDLKTTAKRLVWGKSINSGQTCLAPNHLLVEEDIKDDLVECMCKSIIEFYGENPLDSPDLGKIINSNQFNRLIDLLNQIKTKNQILFGGDVDNKNKRISPTLIELDSINDPLIEEELFGPILPIVSIPNLDFAISEIRKQPKPLAIYMFGGSGEQQKTLLDKSSSGGVCFNDVVMQAAIPELPFGGVGNSGMGRYHGKAGFDNFSHQKSILERPFWLDIQFRYPPYKIDISLFKKLFR